MKQLRDVVVKNKPVRDEIRSNADGPSSISPRKVPTVPSSTKSQNRVIDIGLNAKNLK